MKTLWCALLLTWYCAATAQTSEIDSLKKILPHQQNEAYVQCASDLAWYILSFNTDEALNYARLAQNKAQQLGNTELLANVENDLSLVFLKRNEFDSAIFYANSAYATRLKLGQTAKASASLSKVGNAYASMGKYDEALRIYFESLRLAESAKDSVKYTQICGNIGVTYEKNLNFEEALVWHAKTMSMAKSLGDMATYMNAKVNQGICNNKLNRTAQAIQVLTEALNEAEPLEMYDQMGSILQSLGVANRNLGKHEEGLKYYMRALEIYKMLDDVAAQALILVNIGNAHTDLNNLAAADSSIYLGLKLAQNTHSLEIMRDAYKGLYLLHKKRGNLESAIGFLEQYVAYNDSMYTDNSNKAIAELNVKYQAEKKQNQLLSTQNELHKSQAEVERRNTYIALASVLALALVVLIWLLALRAKMKQERQRAEHAKAMEKERLRISRDLHDNLGAELTWISSELDIKAYELRPEALKNDIQAISNKTREAMRSLRETIWAIHNDNLALSEIGTRLKEQTAQVCKDKNILFTVESQEEVYYNDPNTIIHVYRICKEAVNNALKHANANHIRMVFRSTSPLQTTIEIADNGIGYERSASSHSYGLRNMEERALEIGAHISYNSKKGEGTIVTLTLHRTTTQS